MNDYNKAVAYRVLAVIAGLEIGDLTLDEAHAALQSAIPCFENDGSGVATAVRLAEADLERIQFGVVLDDQLRAATSLLGKLRSVIEGAVDE